MEIENNGSVQGQLFSGEKYNGQYPYPSYGKETFAQYRSRVDVLKAQGFHLGDLSWSDWNLYCMGSGQYDGVDSNNIIGD